MVFVLHLLTIGPLWDRTYIDMIREDWNQGPLTDIKMLEAGEDCPDGWENIARAWWWGLKQGCDCPGGRTLKLEVCTDKEKKDDHCKDQIRRQPRWLDVINGKQICGKRAYDYNFLKMSKPEPYTVTDTP